MKIVRIIAEPKPTLYAIRFSTDKSNELDRNFELWNDPEYLRSFFKEHSSDLRRYGRYHKRHYSINDAVRKTLDDAIRLENELLDIAEPDAEGEYDVLQAYFKQLNDMETGLYPLQKSKGKLLKYKSWLRLYAIRIDTDLYVVTGGVIKLTKKMKEREHTQVELDKMKRAVNYLRRKNLINKREFEQLEISL